MTTTADQYAAPSPSTNDRGVGPAGLLKSEWIKFRTLRSTWIAVLVAILLGVGLGALISLAVAHSYDRTSTDVFDPTQSSFFALAFGQLAFVVLGSMTITSEYSTGMIRTSLTCVPLRGRMLAAKAAVLVAVSFVVGLVIAFPAFLIGQAILKSEHNSRGVPYATLGQPHVLRAVIGIGLFLATLSLMTMAIGTMIRNTAGTISIMVGAVFVVPGVSAALPDKIHNGFTKFWPTDAGQQIFSVHRDHHTLHSWPGLGWMVLVTIVLVFFATLVLRKRDA